MSTETIAETGQSKSFLMNQRAAEQEEVVKQLKEEKEAPVEEIKEVAVPKVEQKIPETPKQEKTATKSSGRIAVILVRGLVKVTHSVKYTLEMLHLTRKNCAVVIEDNPVNRGMLQKAKDYITWGEISEEVFSKLLEKRGIEYQGRLTDSKKKYAYRVLEVNGKKYKGYFRLSPPRKGFGRKGVKMPFKLGGALGNRSGKINDLIERML